MFLRLVFVGLIVIFLTGCGGMNSYNKLEVTDVKTKQFVIPDELLSVINPEKPITREEYLKLSPTEREIYLTNYSISLLKSIKECNINIVKIKDLNNVKQ